MSNPEETRIWLCPLGCESGFESDPFGVTRCQNCSRYAELQGEAMNDPTTISVNGEHYARLIEDIDEFRRVTVDWKPIQKDMDNAAIQLLLDNLTEIQNRLVAMSPYETAEQAVINLE